jgi:hypothetical protein
MKKSISTVSNGTETFPFNLDQKKEIKTTKRKLISQNDKRIKGTQRKTITMYGTDGKSTDSLKFFFYKFICRCFHGILTSR